MDQQLLGVDEVAEGYPDEWILLVDYEEDESFAPVRGRVLAHSKKRSDIYRMLPALKDEKFFILSTGSVPDDTEVLFPWA